MTVKELDELICCWAIEQGLDLTEDQIDTLIDKLLKAQEEPHSH